MHLHPIKILRSHMDPICDTEIGVERAQARKMLGLGPLGPYEKRSGLIWTVSFPVNPRPDGSAPVNRHSKSPIDATRALIGRALVLMTLNLFERVTVSLKLVSMLLHYSSPPAFLVFAVFSCEQNLKRPSRIEFEL